jgi:hypothetical protein
MPAYRFDQMFVKLDARHIWHMNIRDQAICDREFGGRKKFGGGREHGNGVVQRLEQPAHRVAERLVVIDD